MRLEDDFYRYINQTWLDTAEIPNDRPGINNFVELHDQVEARNLAQAAEWLADPAQVADKPHLANYVRLLALIRNEKARAKNEVPALMKHLKKLDRYAGWDEVLADFKAYREDGLPFPLSVDVSPDMKNSDCNMIYIGPAATILPDSTYYQPDHPQGEQLLKTYRDCSGAYLEALGLEESKVAELLDGTIAFDRVYAPTTKSGEESAEYVNSYNPLTLAEYAAKLPESCRAFATRLQEIYGITSETLLSDTEPRFTENVGAIFAAENFAAFKAWATVRIALGAAAALTDDLRILGGAYSRALSGVKAARSFEKYSYDLAHSYFSGPVGLDYAQRNFGAAAKADVLAMLKKMIANYAVVLRQNDWLSESTRDKAVVKLENLQMHVGYPDKLAPLYDRLEVEVDQACPSLFVTLQHLNRISYLYGLEEFARPVDRDLWHMPADMVNAYYSPSANCIVFPAAILQPPFYDLAATKAANYGAIGAVMAHEISHAFDNNGAQFDEKGNLNDWWQPNDYTAFRAKTEAMIKLFDSESTEAGTCNGKLTVSENIADAGGLSCAYQVCMTEDPEHLADFFSSWARGWRHKSSLAYAKLLLSIDVHAPCELRGNVQLKNLPAFQKYYHLQPSDKMYLAPEAQVRIW